MSTSSLASKVIQTSNTLKSSTRQMRSEVEAAKIDWSGSSYESFRTAYIELENKFSSVNSSWQNVASQLNRLAREVETAERDKKAKLQASRKKNK